MSAGAVLGTQVGPFDTTIDRAYAQRYAEAVRDHSPRTRTGEAIASVAIASRIWDAQNAARAQLVAVDGASGGVHGEHDVVLHRPLNPGEALSTWVEACGAWPAGRNAAVCLRYVTLDASESVVAEQWWTTIYLGAGCEPAGDRPPDHAFPEAARARPAGACAVEVDAAMAHRYAEVSGDWSPHHFDADAARRSGAPGPFLHGVATMALCASGVAQVVAGGDTERVRRVAVRFATPAAMGSSLQIEVFDADAHTFAFEARCGDDPVITHGRMELR